MPRDTMRAERVHKLPNGRHEATVTFTADTRQGALIYIGRALKLLQSHVETTAQEPEPASYDELAQIVAEAKEAGSVLDLTVHVPIGGGWDTRRYTVAPEGEPCPECSEVCGEPMECSSGTHPTPEQLMAHRIEHGRDPISGEPWRICPPYRVETDRVPVCVGCGRTVRMTPLGSWEHVER